MWEARRRLSYLNPIRLALRSRLNRRPVPSSQGCALALISRRASIAAIVIGIMVCSVLLLYATGRLFPPVQEIDGSLLLATGDGVFYAERLAQGATKWQQLAEGVIRAAALSPDLNYLAYAKETPSGADAIYVLDIRNGKSKTLVTLDLADKVVVGMDWSPDSSTLLYLTYGERRALFLTTLNTQPSAVVKARSQTYVGILNCPSTESTVFGQLEGRWGAKNIIVVQEFTGPFPFQVECAVTILYSDSTYFLHVGKLGAAQDLPRVWSKERWRVAIAIPPGEMSLLCKEAKLRSQYEWYVASSAYFTDPTPQALARIKACEAEDGMLGPLEWDRARASLDTRFIAWGRGTSVAVLDLKSKEIRKLYAPQGKQGIFSVAWDPSRPRLAVLTFQSGDKKLTVLVIDTQTSNTLDLGPVPSPPYSSLQILAWIPGRNSTAGRMFMSPLTLLAYTGTAWHPALFQPQVLGSTASREGPKSPRSSYQGAKGLRLLQQSLPQLRA